MERRDCQGKHDVDAPLHFFFPLSLILLTDGFCMTCFQQRLVTGCTDKSLLCTRNQTQFPHRTYSCRGEGHTPDTPKRDAGNWLRPWALLLSLSTAWKGLFLHGYIGTFLVFSGLHEASIIRTVVFTPTLSFKGHATEGRDRMKEGNGPSQTGSVVMRPQKSALHCAPQFKCQFGQV